MAGPPIVTVQLPPPDFPRSYAPNWIPPAEHVDEMDAIESLKEEWVRYPVEIPEYDSYTTSRKILIADVNNYEIYISPGQGHRQDSELQPLHHLDIKAKSLSLDGFVSLGNVRHWIEMSAITSYSIEGYDDDENPGIVAYVQTEAARNDQDYDIWYCLKRPAPPYRRVDKAFRWVSTFGKHAMDYLAIQPMKSVGLDRFRNDFARWLTARFPRNEELKKWMMESQTKDFRVAFHAYVDYLAYQAWNLPESAGLLSHPVWADCMKGDQHTIKQQPMRTKGTITSPKVYQLFKHMYFGECLKEMAPVHEVQQVINKRKQMLGFPKEQDADFVPTSTTKDSNSPIKPGDVVSIRPDEREQKTWGTPGEDWLAYVQGVSPLEDGTMKLSVLWIYHPSDTTIAGAVYPVQREVFLSDNCNCGDLQLRSTDVIRRFTVDWSPKDLNTSKELIIRSKYTENKCFVTLKDEDRQCTCGKPKPLPIDGCRPGETVYYSTVKDGQRILEPGVVRRVNKALNEVTVQRFLRLKRDCPRTPDAVRPGGIADNELVLTDTTINVPAARIDRKCKLRFFPKKIVLSGEVPFPYNLGGAIDFWFFSMEQSPAQQFTFLSKAPSWIRQGSDPGIDELPDQLRGLSMFSGSGNLDRGLEEGGAVKFEWSVDMSGHAVHTQRANAIGQDKLNLYWGSVDDYLKALLEGHNMTTVARVGNVMFIAAGSPCPGFSCMQQNILSEQSKRNSSHITTFATAVDMYRPLYGILENVPHMSAKRKGLENQNVLSQVVACLVSLGYQVTQFLMDSWNFGSPQRRSRLFIAVTAPGLEPIMAPIHTHSSPEKTTNKSLGTLRNGEKFGEREFYPTPFETVTAGQATAHLPHIGTSNIQTCIRFPDHRLVGIPNRKDRKLMEHIPTFPPSQGYAEAVELGLMPQSLMKKMKENKRSFRRIDQDALFPTIKTNISPQDGRGDASLHWEEHRPIGVQEAREAQGFPRTEVLIGSTLEQWRLIGNAVDRKVSLAQGFVLREAVIKNRGITRNEAVVIKDDPILLDKDIDKILDRALDNDPDKDSAISSIEEPVAAPVRHRGSSRLRPNPKKPKRRQSFLSEVPSDSEVDAVSNLRDLFSIPESTSAGPDDALPKERERSIVPRISRISLTDVPRARKRVLDDNGDEEQIVSLEDDEESIYGGGANQDHFNDAFDNDFGNDTNDFMNDFMDDVQDYDKSHEHENGRDEFSEGYYGRNGGSMGHGNVDDKYLAEARLMVGDLVQMRPWESPAPDESIYSRPFKRLKYNKATPGAPRPVQPMLGYHSRPVSVPAVPAHSSVPKTASISSRKKSKQPMATPSLQPKKTTAPNRSLLKKTLKSSPSGIQPNAVPSSSNAAKRTRHSGSQVEYIPTQWNKVPEKLWKKSGRLW